VADKTGYPREMLELGMGLDADLGIDSIKRVEILSALQEKLPEAPAVRPEDMGQIQTLGDIVRFIVDRAPPAVQPATESVAAPTKSGRDEVAEVLLGVVADKTGYPREMLELDMGLDADLGIDSIKRVEILSALQEKQPEAPAVRPEDMGQIQTLGDLVRFIVDRAPPAVQPATESVAAPTKSGRDEVAEVLLGVVADKTGYPREMLELGMGLDADLGIDSIKRVEILSALQEKLPEAPAVRPEDMGQLQTLGDLVVFITRGLDKAVTLASAPASFASVSGTPRTAEIRARAVDRWVLGVEPADVATRAPSLAPGSEVWVCGEDEELVDALVGQLGALGYKAVVAGEDTAVSEALRGLVLVGSTGMGDAAVLRAFSMLRKAGRALEAASMRDSVLVGAVVRLDGQLGLGPLNGSQDVTSAALAGLVKTAAQEWPMVTGRVIDLPGGDGDVHGAAAVVEALLHATQREIGIDGGSRWTTSLRRLPTPQRKGATLSGEDVVVVSGGARGVTAEVACAMAQDGAGHLVLLGRSPEPLPEPAHLSGITDEGALKRAIAEAQDGPLKPVELQRQFRAIEAAREIRATLHRIREAGATCHYLTVDVTDAEAVTRAIEGVRAELGPITALVHGAGVLRDRAIHDKTDADFAMVYDTKVKGVRALLAATAGDPLRFVVLFSSSTGRFGRRGQADYAAGNEVLNKTGQVVARQRPGCRVVSVNWGPWDGGMVGPELRAVFAAEGITVIPLERGAAHLLDELACSDGPVETVVLGEGSRPAELGSGRSPKTLEVETALPVVFTRRIDIGAQPYLRSHVIGGRAVFPMAMMVEWLSHAALHGNPGLRFGGFDELRVFKGITLEAGASVEMEAHAGPSVAVEGGWQVVTELRSRDDQGRPVPHARALVLLVDTPPKGVASPVPALERCDHTTETIYGEVLFHGPALHALERIEGIAPDAIAAHSRTSPAPREWEDAPLRGRWIADPLAIDAAFQLIVLWTDRYLGHRSLPTRGGSYRQFASFPREDVRIVARIVGHDAHRANAVIEWIDDAGKLIARLDDYECVVDPSLARAFQNNRLGTRLSTIQ